MSDAPNKDYLLPGVPGLSSHTESICSSSDKPTVLRIRLYRDSKAFPHFVSVCVHHLQWILGADGDDLILVVAQLTGPGASLADPLDEAGLMGAAD